jgi:hypothetical protein
MCDFADLTEKYIITAGKSFGLRAGDFLRFTRRDLAIFRQTSADFHWRISYGQRESKSLSVY